MNLKKIILEEVNDFEWVENVEANFLSFLKQYSSEGPNTGKYKIWIDGISMEDQLTMMNKLYDQGFQWRGGHGRYNTSFANIPILILNTDTMEIEWNQSEAGDNWDAFQDREYETPKTQIPTDEFFDMLGMNVTNIKPMISESNDFDWVKKIEADTYMD
jgi:hypothetical protein